MSLKNKQLLIAEVVLRNLDMRRIRKRHAQILGLAAGVAARESVYPNNPAVLWPNAVSRQLRLRLLRSHAE